MTHKAITLTELLIAVSLMATIILAAASFDTASSTFLKSSERRVALMNELSLVQDYLQKDVSLSIGDTARSPMAIYPASSMDPNGLTSTALTFVVFTDINHTPSNTSDDVSAWYGFPGVYGNGTYLTHDIQHNGRISNRVTNYDIDVLNGTGVSNWGGGVCFRINNLTLRYDPNSPADNQTNPEASVSNVTMCSPGCSRY